MILLDDSTLTVRHCQKNFLLSSRGRNEVKKRLPSRQPSARTPAPFEELPKCRAAVTVLRFFLGSQLGESFLNIRKIKQRIVTEAIRPTRGVEDCSFGRAAKRCQPMLRIEIDIHLHVDQSDRQRMAADDVIGDVAAVTAGPAWPRDPQRPRGVDPPGQAVFRPE